MKKWILFLCVAILLFTSTSCDQKQNGNLGQKISSKSGQQAQDPLCSFTILNNKEMNCANEEGYYYISNQEIKLENGSYAYRLMYMDYASKKEIVLCNRPGCNHDTDECPAVFTQDEANMAGSLFLYNGYIYLFSHSQDQNGVTTVQSNDTGSSMQEEDASITGTPACLYRMKTDGTDRKLVFSFDLSLSVEDIVLSKNTSMYFITKKLSSEQIDNKISYVTSTERTLIQVDTESWKSAAVCRLDSDWKIEDVYNDKLVISQILFNHELTKDELHNEQSYKNAIKNSQTQFSVFNPADGKTESVVKLSNKNLNSSAVQNKNLYVSTMGEEKIWKINLNTKEETAFAQTNANQILAVYQDVLLCSTWDSTDSNTQDQTSYFIHLDDATIDKSELVTASMGTPVEICGEMKDTFLVIHDIDAKKDTSFGNDQYSINGYKYALIKKDDLYKGKANYSPIQMVGFGK